MPATVQDLTPAVVYLFLAGGLGLALCDQMHVQAGVLSHEAPGPFGQGWWVAPMFGVASLVIVAVARRIAPPRPAGGGEVALAAGVFVAAYAATALFSEDHPYLLAAALWATAIARIAAGPDRAATAGFALLLAVSGPLVEFTVAATGVFDYDQRHALVALWLSGLYLHGAPLALAIARLPGLRRKVAGAQEERAQRGPREGHQRRHEEDLVQAGHEAGLRRLP